MIKQTCILSCFFLLSAISVSSQDQILIGNDGIMRWRKDSAEITGFGVNYTVPFAHAYRAGKRLGVDLRKAIDEDVYHFSRLGLDLFRVHVWDCEISDTAGNLLENEHLELFDYLLHRLNQRGIKSVITPIAYWGNGWPEPDEPTPGFSTKYGKENCLTDPDAIRAQEKYLYQFVSHVNPYTGIAYKDDPMILAFEVCNEPHHRGTPEEVTVFVRKMKDAISSTGCTKPVFYNVTHSIHLAEAYFNADIDGGTFQWYPTGLGFQKELKGNMLPNVDRYRIPFDDVLKKNYAARFVYEFDAADMASNYMYPAMARSFRSAGMQLATHFSYDPTFLAPYNTEYNTHFMNLVYAPQKALSLMICGEVFRKIPLYAEFGSYPNNTSFGPFRVSFEENLSEMVTDEKFIYTNHSSTRINDPKKLKLIAGWGNSSLIKYPGTGAYFLDKLANGIWRLELMPDAVIVDNLFGQNNTDTRRAEITYQRHPMKILLPEFTQGYYIQSVDWKDSIIFREVHKDDPLLFPGVYILMAPDYNREALAGILAREQTGEFSAPPASGQGDHKPFDPCRSGQGGGSPDPVILFDAATHYTWLNRQWVRGSGWLPDTIDDRIYLTIKLDGLVRHDRENPNATPVADYSIRHYFGDIIAGRTDIADKKKIVLDGFTEGEKNFPVQLALVMKDGAAFGGIIEMTAGKALYELPLSALQRIKAVLLPRPYPTFLPYYSDAGEATTLDLLQIESLQISIGPGIPENKLNAGFELKIRQVSLE